MIKSNKNMHSLNIFDNKYLYTANADDTTFFLKAINQASQLRMGGQVPMLPPTFTEIVLCQGCFAWKFAFASFSKASKTFLSPALPESCRGYCKFNKKCFRKPKFIFRILWNLPKHN